MTSTLALSAEERQGLISLMRARSAPASAVKRARLILMLDEGLSWSVIGDRLPCSPDYIGRWKRRFAEERMAGLYARHRGGAPGRDAARVEARVLAWTQKAPTDGSTHWTTRKLARLLGLSPHDGGPHLGQARHQAAPARALHGLRRPRLRGQGGRCDRALPQSPGARGGVLRR